MLTVREATFGELRKLIQIQEDQPQFEDMTYDELSDSFTSADCRVNVATTSAMKVQGWMCTALFPKQVVIIGYAGTASSFKRLLGTHIKMLGGANGRTHVSLAVREDSMEFIGIASKLGFMAQSVVEENYIFEYRPEEKEPVSVGRLTTMSQRMNWSAE